MWSWLTGQQPVSPAESLSDAKAVDTLLVHAEEVNALPAAAPVAPTPPQVQPLSPPPLADRISGRREDARKAKMKITSQRAGKRMDEVRRQQDRQVVHHQQDHRAAKHQSNEKRERAEEQGPEMPESKRRRSHQQHDEELGKALAQTKALLQQHEELKKDVAQMKELAESMKQRLDRWEHQDDTEL